jgi:DNA-binding NtrC family response regulator
LLSLLFVLPLYPLASKNPGGAHVPASLSIVNEVFLMTSAIAPSTFVVADPHPVEGPVLLNLLIVDEDRLVREACREAATVLGYCAHASQSAEQALWLIESQPTDVVLLGLDLPNARRLDILREIKRRRPDVEVIVISGNANVHSAVQSMKDGAYDFLAKPFGLQDLKPLLERVAAQLKLKVKNRRLSERIKSDNGFENIIGRAPEMDELYRIIGKAARSAHPVLILGESGTGKEMVARAIHHSGPFRDKPFVPVDCGALVPTLIESELFGYVKGAFTGAVQSKTGLLALAEGGTVFLDEVGELPIDLQAKLLRALQEKEIRPVGSNETSFHQRAYSSRHESRLGAGRGPRSVPPRPVLPSQCLERTSCTSA